MLLYQACGSIEEVKKGTVALVCMVKKSEKGRKLQIYAHILKSL